jgi:hypothetical protein
MFLEIQPGTRWIHHSGRIYEVLYRANDVPEPKSEYPLIIVYKNIDNGTIWAGRADDWHRRMKTFPV